jgi:hypothetical protein
MQLPAGSAQILAEEKEPEGWLDPPKTHLLLLISLNQAVFSFPDPEVPMEIDGQQVGDKIIPKFRSWIS